MSLFLKRLDDITFRDIEHFCERYTEGVRVEYTTSFDKDLPKAISALANSMGGVLLIGVRADGNGRAEKPIAGLPLEDGIEERIVQSSITAIYPPVVPDVTIRDVPNGNGNVVAVIRVNESLDAPHAIQNSTRVYIRTGSISQPYALAEIDRVEFLLKRRTGVSRKKEELLGDADARLLRRGGRLATGPFLKATIIPVFPRLPIIPLESLDEFVTTRFSPEIDVSPIRVARGVIIPGQERHAEINSYGLVYVRHLLEFDQESITMPGSGERQVKLSLSFERLAIFLAKALKFARRFYEKCGYLGSAEITVTVSGVRQCLLSYADGSGYVDKVFLRDYFSEDDVISSSWIIRSCHEEKEFLKAEVETLREICWAFQKIPGDFDNRVKKIFDANK